MGLIKFATKADFCVQNDQLCCKNISFPNPNIYPRSILAFFLSFFPRLYNVSTTSSKQTINFKIAQETSEKNQYQTLASLKSEFITLGFLFMKCVYSAHRNVFTDTWLKNPPKILLSWAESPLNDGHWSKKGVIISKCKIKAPRFCQTSLKTEILPFRAKSKDTIKLSKENLQRGCSAFSNWYDTQKKY